MTLLTFEGLDLLTFVLIALVAQPLCVAVFLSALVEVFHD